MLHLIGSVSVCADMINGLQFQFSFIGYIAINYPLSCCSFPSGIRAQPTQLRVMISVPGWRLLSVWSFANITTGAIKERQLMLDTASSVL